MKHTAVKSAEVKSLTNTQRSFVDRAVERKKLFLALSIVGVAVGLCLAAYYLWQWSVNPAFSPTLPFVVVILVLLNARQNLRQHKYAAAIEVLVRE